MKCERRFFAAAVPPKFFFAAHCGRCGNFDLQRIAKQHVSGWFAWIPRLAGVPAYRCDPCRNRFFSIRPLRKIQPAEDAATKSKRASLTRPFPSTAEVASAQSSVKTTPPEESKSKNAETQAHTVIK
jgi:hypothetical protein